MGYEFNFIYKYVGLRAASDFFFQTRRQAGVRSNKLFYGFFNLTSAKTFAATIPMHNGTPEINLRLHSAFCMFWGQTFTN